MRKLLFILILTVFYFFSVFFVLADELADINHQLENLQRTFNDIKKAADTNEVALANLNKQLGQIKAKVADIEAQIDKKEIEVKQGEQILSYQKELLNERARSYYKNISKSTLSLITLLTAENLSTSLKNFVYQKSLVDEDRKTIIKVVTYVNNLEDKKVSLQSEKERLASLNIPRSAGTSARGCSDDRGVDPGFSPRLAFFTYGAPHRKGMNQYGAWGRAKDGQNEEQILQAYYPNMSLKKDYDQGVQISTTTGWSGSIEEYVKRIYEVPDSWTDNNLAVLKAQAVAARTYALNVTGNGSKQICTTEQCQVFQSDPKGDNWEQAVNATVGWVLMDGGGAGFTQYASTHGGYILNLGKFDGRVGNPGNFSELNERAYDKESPWFYCDWGSRANYNKTAWLKPSEVADIVNVILLARADSGTKEKLYQTDKPHPFGGEVWNEDRVKLELRSRNINPYTSVSDVSVSVDFGEGRVNSVTVLGDAGGTSFSGSEFKDWFNLRAPANIQIVGPLFNIEEK